MHADEAVLADKFGTLLATGAYSYDPHEYHGPMLTRLAWIPAHLTGRTTYAALTGRDMSDFLFHRVLAMYKLGVIFLQLGLRWRSGATTEPRYAGLTAIGTGIVEFAHEIAQGRAF